MFPQVITLVLDGWTDSNNTSVWVIIALLPSIGPIVLETFNASAESHTGEWIIGNDGGGCQKGRRLTKEASPHLVIQRYSCSALHMVTSLVFVCQALGLSACA